MALEPRMLSLRDATTGAATFSSTTVSHNESEAALLEEIHFSAMAEHLQSNVSQDLVWEICRTPNFAER